MGETKISLIENDISFSKLPLIPNVGPCEGCLTQEKTFLCKQDPMACDKPIVVVDFPSPRGVGVILFV